jgi:hypothetical protein
MLSNFEIDDIEIETYTCTYAYVELVHIHVHTMSAICCFENQRLTQRTVKMSIF